MNAVEFSKLTVVCEVRLVLLTWKVEPPPPPTAEITPAEIIIVDPSGSTQPMLETVGWKNRLALEELVFDDRWGQPTTLFSTNT